MLLHSLSPSELDEDKGAVVLYLIIDAAILVVLVAATFKVALLCSGSTGVAIFPLGSLLAIVRLYRDCAGAQSVTDLPRSSSRSAANLGIRS